MFCKRAFGRAYGPPGRYRFENVETGESFEQEIGEETAVVLRASEKPQSVLLHYVKL